MNGDGHIGGDKFLCEEVCIVQIKATRKEKHFTVIGLTNLLGESICFVVTIEEREFFLIFSLELIYISRKLEMRAMEKNNSA